MMDPTIISSAQTCLNCSDRVTGGANTSTSQCKLRKGRDGIRNYDAYRVDFSANILDTMWFSGILFFMSLRNFNQLDATSKVRPMYRHEIISSGNKAYLINNYLFRHNVVATSLENV